MQHRATLAGVNRLAHFPARWRKVAAHVATLSHRHSVRKPSTVVGLPTEKGICAMVKHRTVLPSLARWGLPPDRRPPTARAGPVVALTLDNGLDRVGAKGLFEESAGFGCVDGSSDHVRVSSVGIDAKQRPSDRTILTCALAGLRCRRSCPLVSLATYAWP